MLAPILFLAGFWLSVWGMHLYAKSRNRYDNRFERLFEDAQKDKLTKDNLRDIKKVIILGITASILLLIAIVLKYNHFIQYSQENYRGEYIWIAPILIIFNVANIVFSFAAIKNIKKQ